MATAILRTGLMRSVLAKGVNFEMRITPSINNNILLVAEKNNCLQQQIYQVIYIIYRISINNCLKFIVIFILNVPTITA